MTPIGFKIQLKQSKKTWVRLQESLSIKVYLYYMKAAGNSKGTGTNSIFEK